MILIFIKNIDFTINMQAYYKINDFTHKNITSTIIADFLKINRQWLYLQIK
jgi:hypothetical protein